MIIVEISNIDELDNMINYQPFIYRSLPTTHQTASYWINQFGCPDESYYIIVHIIDTIRDYNNYYSKVLNLEDCKDNEQSFFWDIENHTEYIHVEHEYNQLYSDYEYGIAKGYSKEEAIYINDLYYEALITSVPSIEQQQDLVNYDKLAFLSGSIVLKNQNGSLDEFINIDITGTQIKMYYIDTSNNQLDYSRDEMTSIATFYIEDLTISQKEMTIDVQDMRKKQNIQIPTLTFDSSTYPNIKDSYIDDVIPLIYGQVRRSEAIPVDGETGTGTTTYRQALTLTSLGTVQVEIDDLWTTKTPTSIDLANGSFTLSQADSRKGNGTPYKCRVINSIGIANTYSSDIIKDLNERYINVDYNDSLYNRTEWEAEETSLESIGIVFNKSIELYEAIRLIQTGSNVGFRYEIAADGRRTIRIDNISRERDYYIQKEMIKNIFESSIQTDIELLSAYTKVKYAKDYESKKYLSVTNSDYAQSVLESYREQPTVELETSLITQSQAEDRAELYASRYSNMPRIVSLTLIGSEYFELRIYDVLDIEITNGFVDRDSGQVTGDRIFFGIWKVQVLSINPNFDELTNEITAYLIEEIEGIDEVRITDSGAIRLLEDGYYKRSIGV